MLMAIFVCLVLLALAFGIYYVGKWAIGELALGEPFSRIANIVLVLLVVAFLLLIVLPKILALFGISIG